jgi:cytochrome c
MWRMLGFCTAAKTAAAFGACVLLNAATVHAAPDLELGRYLANQCMTCHRTAKTGGVAIPNIFGVPAAHLVAQMKAYRDRKLPNEVMQTQAANLKDDEIEALAAYFARAKKP